MKPEPVASGQILPAQGVPGQGTISQIEPGHGPAIGSRPTSGSGAPNDRLVALHRSGRRPDAPGEELRTRTPRQDSGEKSSALSLFFEPNPPADTDAQWLAQMARVPHGHRGDTAVSMAPTKRAKAPRSPAAGLIALLVFAFLATFFAWFSAGPLLLTLGHAHRGVATVANCPIAGIDKRCAQFVADNNAFTAQVTLLGPASAEAPEGATIPAEMVSPTETIAYSGDDRSLYLRWIPGLVIVLLCGFGIAWATGSFRLAGRRAKSLSLLISIAGPILLAVGMLAITW